MEKEEKVIGDIYLAAVFLAYKIPIARINREIPRNQKFIFNKDCDLTIYTIHSGTILTVRNATLDDIETNYASDTLMFPPSYVEAIHKVKSLIHSNDSKNPHSHMER